MKAKTLVLLLSCAIVVVTAGASLGLVPVNAGDAPTTQGPGETVAAFYGWYLDYIGTGEMVRNPLVDGAYRTSERLAPEFVQKVDALLAGFDGGVGNGGYDPFLQAQDVPEWVRVDELASDGAEATASVITSFEGHRFTVHLVQVDGHWLIDRIG